MSRCICPFFVLASATVLIAYSFADAQSPVFGVGDYQFEMEFVTIGNPGNEPAESLWPGLDPVGSVPYTFWIGKFEVSQDIVRKANASSEVDGTGGNLEIPLSNFDDFVFDDDDPVIDLSWEAAARFVNWLNTSSGFLPAYKFDVQPGEEGYSPIPFKDRAVLWDENDPGYSPDNPLRNTLARYVLPSLDEWHKAAYHDSSAGTAGVYFDYPTSSNVVPTRVGSGTEPGTAVWGQPFTESPASVTQAGGLSPYGTMGQGGNAWEHQESYPRTPSLKGTWIRGGHWQGEFPDGLSSTFLTGSSAAQAGFRVAMLLPVGDFDEDALLSAADINLLSEQARLMVSISSYDLNRDGLVDQDDRAYWVEQVARTHFGDADLNGRVDFDDFVLLSNSFNTASGWEGGDFDGSGVTDFDDFVILSNNFGATSDTTMVPEPNSERLIPAAFAILPLLVRRWMTRDCLRRLRMVSKL